MSSVLGSNRQFIPCLNEFKNNVNLRLYVNIYQNDSKKYLLITFHHSFHNWIKQLPILLIED